MTVVWVDGVRADQQAYSQVELATRCGKFLDTKGSLADVARRNDTRKRSSRIGKYHMDRQATALLIRANDDAFDTRNGYSGVLREAGLRSREKNAEVRSIF